MTAPTLAEVSTLATIAYNQHPTADPVALEALTWHSPEALQRAIEFAQHLNLRHEKWEARVRWAKAAETLSVALRAAQGLQGD